MATRTCLRQLADLAGILPSYVDSGGKHRHHTSNATRVALLAAMGWDGATESAARQTLAQLADARRNELLPPVRVLRLPLRTLLTTLQLPAPRAGDAVTWLLELLDEKGRLIERREGRKNIPRARAGFSIRHRRVPPEGYYTLRATVQSGAATWHGEQSLIITPPRCWTIDEALGARRGWGIWTNLYSLRSRRNWGVGDFTDLRNLARNAAKHGADLLGINPLHAVWNTPHRVAPYSPVSRLFRNLIYLDIAAVPEFRRCTPAQQLVASRSFQRKLAALRTADAIDYPRIAALKLRAMDLLFQAFAQDIVNRRSPSRHAAFLSFLDRGGVPLAQYLQFMALAGRFAGNTRRATDWHYWPAALRSPTRPAGPEDITGDATAWDLHLFIQFELDRQLALAQQSARRAGMSLGLYGDLAVGSARDGSDAWAHRDLFVEGATIGCPPDPLAERGQNWNLPPMNPHALRASGYRYWVSLLRHACAHVGMLRLDHVMGLFRLFWIPQGRPASEGAYVQYPAEDLLGIVALESRRNRVVMVGEDLGTVPPEVPPALADRGILSCRVLYFERSGNRFKSPSTYSPRALATVNTHDFAPQLGYWTGSDLELRRTLGLLTRQEADQAGARRHRERAALIRTLRNARLLAKEDTEDVAAMVRAVHLFLARARSPLIALSWDDLAGEWKPVNLPGVGPKRFPSWSRRMARTLENLTRDRTIHETLQGVHSLRANPRQRSSRGRSPAQTPP